ncbi:hypothetical protein DPMN_076613 [Dreissena polymorpha]|uniref:Uncharacterized protein n=1 Tax=Dreissena polymorpha TaxID=45954 RepID=A0A9D3YNZ8_DREPO|nr:hypothetical protein DPMN_076613 [Dreissena polymorpha]
MICPLGNTQRKITICIGVPHRITRDKKSDSSKKALSRPCFNESADGVQSSLARYRKVATEVNVRVTCD